MKQRILKVQCQRRRELDHNEIRMGVVTKGLKATPVEHKGTFMCVKGRQGWVGGVLSHTASHPTTVVDTTSSADFLTFLWTAEDI